MARIIVSPRAEDDLAEIWAYIAVESGDAGVADRWIDHLAERFEPLSEFPFMGRERAELGPGVRSFPVDDYVIFYRPLSDGIEVARVVHGTRDPAGLTFED